MATKKLKLGGKAAQFKGPGLWGWHLGLAFCLWQEPCAGLEPDPA